MIPRKRFWPIMIVSSIVVLIFAILLCITIGPANITLKESFLLLLAAIPKLGALVDISQFSSTQQIIMYEVRMPRIVLAAIVGAGLSAVGVTFQGLFKNPMADPYVIGVSSGAALGAAVAIVIGFTAFWALPAAAFMGAIVSIVVVYAIANVGGRVVVFTLLLGGVALTSFNTAMMSFLMMINTTDMQQIVFWSLGSFSGKGWTHVQAALPIVLVGIIGLWLLSRELNAMLFGEDTAQFLGVNPEKLKKVLLFLSALTVAAAVSVSGTIGFVGLIIPHMVRLVVGPDHRILLPMSVLVGAIFMVITDTLARTILAPTEIPVGIITAFLGCPFFIYLLKRKKSVAG